MPNALAVNDLCPWSGKPVSADSLTRYRGNTVGFCNPGCRDKFATALSSFNTVIDRAAEARGPYEPCGDRQ